MGKSVEKEEKGVRVKDLMTRNVISISVEKSVMEAASVMTEASISSVLLKSANEFTGVITEHDIISRVVALGLNQQEQKGLAFAKKALKQKPRGMLGSLNIDGVMIKHLGSNSATMP